MLGPMSLFSRILSAIAGLIFLAPSWQADILALIIWLPVVRLQWQVRDYDISTGKQDPSSRIPA